MQKTLSAGRPTCCGEREGKTLSAACKPSYIQIHPYVYNAARARARHTGYFRNWQKPTICKVTAWIPKRTRNTRLWNHSTGFSKNRFFVVLIPGGVYMTSFCKSMLVFYLQMERGIAFILQTPWCSANWIFLSSCTTFRSHQYLRVSACDEQKTCTPGLVHASCFLNITWICLQAANFLEPIL